MSYANPTREQFKALYSLEAGRPVGMLNLLRFREIAYYEETDPKKPETPISGREAYARYSAEAQEPFTRFGGKQLYIGQSLTTLIGPVDESWSLAFIAYYPNVQAFIEVVKSPAYQSAAKHRTAALADGRLIVLAPLEPSASFAPVSYL